MDRLELNLPGAVATAAPQAVREFDEKEAERVRERAHETALGGILVRIASAQSMQDFARLDCFSFNGADNILTCADCSRYSSFAP
eukprot:6892657-Prymnesium_polylepis.1